MNDDNLGKQLENLFNLPKGSMANTNGNDAAPILVKGVQDKTDELTKKLDKNDVLRGLPSSDLSQVGTTLDELEADRMMIRREALDVYQISRALLNKLYMDVKDQIGVNDRMYNACAKMVDTVTSNIHKLFEMNQRLRTEEEFKVIANNGNGEDDRSKPMTTDQWIEWVEAAKDEDPDEPLKLEGNVKDTDVNE